MKAKMNSDRRTRTGIGPAPILLLSVFAGALMGRFLPEGRALPLGKELLPWVTALPLFFAGNVFGVYGIPAAGLVFGLCAEIALAGLSVSGAAKELSALLPLLLLTPGFFLTAAAGMRLSEDCLSASCEGDGGFRELLGRQAAICGLAFVFLLAYHYLV